MKIGILLTDELRDELKPAFGGSYADMFVQLLAGNGFEFAVYEVCNGKFPDDPAECAGYLITGSRHGVYDDLPWLVPLFDFIRRLHGEKRALLGVCFGHQAVAQALGGRVEKSDKGWGMGAHEWAMTAQADWTAPPLQRLRLLCVHQDQVVQLPPGAELLASSAFCENAAFRIGSHVFCVQGHPEFSPEYVHALLPIFEERGVAQEVLTQAAQTADESVDSELCAKWIAAFFRQAESPANNLATAG